MPWGPSDTTISGSISLGGSGGVLITSAMLRVSVVRGKTDDSGQYGPSTCTVELANPLGELSPENTASPLYPNVRPGMRLGVAATNATVGFQRLFVGYVDTVRDMPALRGDLRSSKVVLTAFDEFGKLAAIDGYERPVVGAGETSGDRMARLLVGEGEVRPQDIALDIGTTRMQDTNLSMNLLDEIHLTADSEFGAVWVDHDGIVRFEDRLALVRNARSNTVQAVFGDGAGQLPITDLQVSDAALTQVINEAAIGRVGGVLQFASDATSRTAYGTRRYSRGDLINDSDTLCAGIANVIVAQKKDPAQRVESITFDATTSTALMTQALTRRIRDRIEIRKQMPGNPPYTLVRQAFVNRIEHEITPTSWITTFGLVSTTNVPTTAPRIGSTFQVGVSQLPI